MGFLDFFHSKKLKRGPGLFEIGKLEFSLLGDLPDETISTEYLGRCLNSLRKAYLLLKETKEGSDNYEICRDSIVKKFEIILEQSGKLLKKKLVPYFPSKQKLDTLTFKEIFRQAHKFSLLNEEETERWLKYRDSRNTTVHDYEQALAEETFLLMDDFLKDAEHLKQIIDHDKSEA